MFHFRLTRIAQHKAESLHAGSFSWQRTLRIGSLSACMALITFSSGTVNSLSMASSREKSAIVHHSFSAPSSNADLSPVPFMDGLVRKAPKVPGPPTNVIVSAGNGRSTVSWSPPSKIGAAAITSYVVRADPGGRSCTYKVGVFETDICTVTGLTNGKNYTITVAAKNAIGVGSASRPAMPVTPSVTPRVTTIFDSEFSGSTLSPNWTAVTGSNPSTTNLELECYSKHNVVVGNGVLREVASTGTSCGADCPPTSTTLCPYVSGAIQWASFSFTYGTVSVRAKFSGGVGTWPAIWLLGSNCQSPTWIDASCDWPAPGSNEIDIAEILRSNTKHVNQQLHTVDASDTVQAPFCYSKTSDVTKNWHTYTVVWAQGSLTWKIDGIQTCQMTTLVPSTPMFLIINTAVGGVGVNRVDASTLPKTTEVDYVRVTTP